MVYVRRLRPTLVCLTLGFLLLALAACGSTPPTATPQLAALPATAPDSQDAEGDALLAKPLVINLRLGQSDPFFGRDEPRRRWKEDFPARELPTHHDLPLEVWWRANESSSDPINFTVTLPSGVELVQGELSWQTPITLDVSQTRQLWVRVNTVEHYDEIRVIARDKLTGGRWGENAIFLRPTDHPNPGLFITDPIPFIPTRTVALPGTATEVFTTTVYQSSDLGDLQLTLLNEPRIGGEILLQLRVQPSYDWERGQWLMRLPSDLMLLEGSPEIQTGPLQAGQVYTQTYRVRFQNGTWPTAVTARVKGLANHWYYDHLLTLFFRQGEGNHIHSYIQIHVPSSGE